MGVISIDGRGLVWGASAQFIRAIIQFAIAHCGKKEYLKTFSTSFEHGYNAIFLADTTIEELMEFRDTINDYLNSNEYLIFGTSLDDKQIVRTYIVDLLDKLDDEIHRRIDASEFR